MPEEKFTSIEEAVKFYRDHPLINVEILSDPQRMAEFTPCEHTPEETEYFLNIERPAMIKVITEYFEYTSCPTQFSDVIVAMAIDIKMADRAEALDQLKSMIEAMKK